MTLPALALLTAIGCSPAPDMRDQRLADYAERSMQEQSRQNEHIARQSQAVVQESQQLAEAAQQLVQSDAEARAEMIAVQERLTGQLDQQRAAVDAGRDQLEQERRQIAEQRHRDPIVAASIQTVGVLVAALLPLLWSVCTSSGSSARSEPDDAAVAELLVHELVTDQPRLLPGPSLRPALEHHARRDLADDPSLRSTTGHDRPTVLIISFPKGAFTLSHIVTIKTEVRDAAAVCAACRRLKLPAPVYDTHRLFSGEETGLGVQLPGWRYPVVCQLDTGQLRYDDYAGRWGKQEELDRFLQGYAVEKARLEARRRGHHVTEQQLPDGSVKLTIHVHGGAA